MKRLFFALFIVMTASAAGAHERLIVLGGSDEIPKEAAVQFVAWSQGQYARILLIPWATQYPDYARNIQEQLSKYTRSDAFATAPTYPMTPAKKALFLRELARATGVYFTGGDQARILKTIEDGEIRSAIVKKFLEGTAFAGTSAGTAIMSRIAIIAENDPNPDGSPNITVGPGLGLLPPDVIVDSHFIIRNREARLRSVIASYPGTFGVGIDEPAGLIVEDGIGKAVGPSAVVVLTDRGKEILQQGDRYNLLRKTRIN